jgi:acetoin utilization protein AcuB
MKWKEVAMSAHHVPPSCVVTVTKEDKLVTARTRMTLHRIRHLPVVDSDGRLIGIVSDRDLRSACPWSQEESTGTEEAPREFSKLKVADIMTPEPHTITPNATLQDVLALFRETRVGALPLVDQHRRLVGIVSETDLLGGFLDILGGDGPGTFVGVRCEDRPDALKRVVDLLTEEKYGIGSVLSLKSWLTGQRVLFVFLASKNIARARAKLRENGLEAMDPMEWFLKRFQQDQVTKSLDQTS